jgi:hypothetical protein
VLYHRIPVHDSSTSWNRYAGGRRFECIGIKLMVEKKEAYGPEKEKKK